MDGSAEGAAIARAADQPTQPMQRVEAPTSRLQASLAWTVALLTAVVLLALTGYTSRDPDSTVYAGIAARMSTEPLFRWIAPEWWGSWGNEGLFREHPVGIFLLPAMLGRLGYPPVQAAYALNAAFQILTLILMSAVAAAFATRRESRALAWALQLILIAFVFRIRANQEYAVLTGLLVALYATERSRTRTSWAWATAAAFAWVLLVKGIFGLMVPALCAVWLAARQRGESARRLAPWAALGATLLVAPLLTTVYELLYRTVSGESFLAFYAGPRLDAEAVVDSPLSRWPYNVVWYTGRLIWYALPWSVFALGALAAYVHHLRGGVSRRIVATMSRESVAGLMFALVSSALLVAGFALSDRKADRFIFPAYFILGGAGAITAVRCSPRFARVVDLLDKPWVPAAFWLALFLLRLASGAHLPRFTFWRS
jgi:hypothetical protein